jgi:hypothetical protein
MRTTRWPRPRSLIALATLAAAVVASLLLVPAGRHHLPSAPAPAPAPVPVPVPVPVPDPLDDAFAAFVSAEFGDVWAAMRVFAADPDAAIPRLVAMLDRDERVELHNTADMIFPGADRFYGHGGVVAEDLDWISARAVWALGKLTFQRFWLDPLRWPGGNDASKLTADRARAVERARAWWRRGVAVTRKAALLEALDGDDARRRMTALQWLGYDARDQPIPGFGADTMRDSLTPRLRRLARHGSADQRDTAQWILDEPPWTP